MAVKALTPLVRFIVEFVVAPNPRSLDMARCYQSVVVSFRSRVQRVVDLMWIFVVQHLYDKPQQVEPVESEHKSQPVGWFVCN